MEFNDDNIMSKERADNIKDLIEAIKEWEHLLWNGNIKTFQDAELKLEKLMENTKYLASSEGETVDIPFKGLPFTWKGKLAKGFLPEDLQ